MSPSSKLLTVLYDSDYLPLEMNLPAEILDYTLSFLQHDPVALRACTKSHPLLSKLAERYLYAHISLRTDDVIPEHNLGIFDLSKFLSNNPHLIHYVRSIHIVFATYDGSDVQVNRHVEEISAILPILSELRTIALEGISGWPKKLPEGFTLAFLDCLRLPSMHQVCIVNIYDIPLMECNPIRSNVLHPNQISQTFELLQIRHCGGPFLNKFCILLQSQGLQFRSLEFAPADEWDGHVTFEPLPSVLTTSSNTLTSLCLDLGVNKAYKVIPVTLCTLPYLERFTVRVELRYLFCTLHGIMQSWEFWSSIPKITQLFSNNISSIPSSLRHITLDFNCTANDLPFFPSSYSLWKIFLSPLVRLLSSISAFDSSQAPAAVKVDLYLRGSASADIPSGDESRLIPMPLPILLSTLFGSDQVMQFVEQGMLSIKPCFLTGSNVGVLDTRTNLSG